MRPKPDILLRTGTESGKPETRILRAKAVYQVLYKGGLFYWTTDRAPDGQPPIYQKSCFPTKKSAENLAMRLNQMFSVEDFTVAQVSV